MRLGGPERTRLPPWVGMSVFMMSRRTPLYRASSHHRTVAPLRREWAGRSRGRLPARRLGVIPAAITRIVPLFSGRPRENDDCQRGAHHLPDLRKKERISCRNPRRRSASRMPFLRAQAHSPRAHAAGGTRGDQETDGSEERIGGDLRPSQPTSLPGKCTCARIGAHPFAFGPAQ